MEDLSPHLRLDFTDLLMTLGFFIAGIFMEVFLLALYVIVFLHGIIPATYGLNLLNGISTIVLYLILLGAIFLALKIRHKNWRQLGFRKVTLTWLVGGLFIGLLYQLFGSLLTALWEHVLGHTSTVQACEVQTGYSDIPLLAFLLIVIIGPIVEEVFFRGLLFVWIKEKWSYMPALLISSLIFALAHSVSVGSSIVILFPILFLAGCGLAYLRQKTHSLYPGIAMHMGFNLIGVVAIFLAPVVCK